MKRRIIAILPVKPLSEGKSRLAGVLSPIERRCLNLQFLERTISLLRAFGACHDVVVTSRDQQVLEKAAGHGFYPLPEVGCNSLNTALASATRVSRDKGADGILILPVDLPLAGVADLQALCHQRSGPSVTLAPDRHGDGTNALFQEPVFLDYYAFGPNSLHRHKELAERFGSHVHILVAPALALDVDTPDDCAAWGATIAKRRTRHLAAPSTTLAEPDWWSPDGPSAVRASGRK